MTFPEYSMAPDSSKQAVYEFSHPSPSFIHGICVICNSMDMSIPSSAIHSLEQAAINTPNVRFQNPELSHARTFADEGKQPSAVVEGEEDLTKQRHQCES